MSKRSTESAEVQRHARRRVSLAFDADDVVIRWKDMYGTTHSYVLEALAPDDEAVEMLREFAAQTARWAYERGYEHAARGKPKGWRLPDLKPTNHEPVEDDYVTVTVDELPVRFAEDE